MKTHISGESSLANELRRSVGEKLHHVDEAATVAIAVDAAKQEACLLKTELDSLAAPTYLVLGSSRFNQNLKVNTHRP
ncbi:hypothetical protein CR513_45298, partial [Mucuna pruriens]